MKCPNCGRDNPDIRLFCAHCGELLPEEDAAEQQAVENGAAAGTGMDVKLPDAPEMPIDTSDDTEFFRRRERARRVYDDPWPKVAPAQQEAPKRRAPSLFDDDDGQALRADDIPEKPPVRQGAPSLGGNAPGDNGRPSTLLPQRDDTLDPDDFFDVHGHTADFDRVSAGQKRAPKLRRGDEFEDPETQSFAMRHMRGIVTLALMVFTLTIVVVWAFTPSAQDTLAKLDLAWSASAYERLGSVAYESGDYSAAGHYYTQALKRAPNKLAYGVYAANSYIETGNTDLAAQAIRSCIALEPYNADYYVALMGIYSGYENMPDADRQLVDEGYRRTGDSRLKNNHQED